MVERTVTTTLSPRSTDRRFDLLSLGTFIIVGLPDGMLGTAWPAMRQSFGVPVGDLGLILLVNTIGSVAVAAFVGRLIQRLGVSVLLAVAGLCAAIGGIGYVAAPGLWLVLSIGPLLGAAAGMMDGGLNTAVALTGRPRLLNLLHGFYGIGTAIGPLVVTAAILAGSWRPTCSSSPSTSPPPPCGPCITAGLPHPMSLALPPTAAPVTIRT
jgi:fucose permease